MQLTLIRHCQSEANARRLWQGRGDTPLTERGREQAAALQGRADLGRFDRVFSSTLDRAVATARLAGFEPELRPGLGEMALGEWDGLTFEEVAGRFGDELRAIRDGEDVSFGRTGETIRDFHSRVTREVEAIVADAGSDDRILIVAHGGTNNAILRHYLATESPPFRTFGAPTNTGVTQITLDGSRHPVLERYNDAAHLGPVSDWTADRRQEGAAVVDLVRHGLTQANRDGRVQGQFDLGGLHPEGEEQARRLGAWIGSVDHVYASPLDRASHTARLAFGGAGVTLHDGLREVHMGEWQGQLWSDVVDRHPAEVRALVEGDGDPRRGVTGENFAEVQNRVTTTIHGIAAAHGSQRVGVVSHGMALRAYLAGILGFDHTRHRLLQRLDNTAFSRVVVTDDGPLIAEYNVTYHLRR